MSEVVRLLPVQDIDDDDRGAMIETPAAPWWTWVASTAIVAACYQLNAGGNGLFALAAAVVLCRLLLARYAARSTDGRHAASIALGIGGFVAYMIVLAILTGLGIIPEHPGANEAAEAAAAREWP